LNKTLLKSFIVRYDKTQLNLARAMGISLSRLNAKINESNGAEFTQSEICFIRDRYYLSNRDVNNIFFTLS
jgi:hypothetical protein